MPARFGMVKRLIFPAAAIAPFSFDVGDQPPATVVRPRQWQQQLIQLLRRRLDADRTPATICWCSLGQEPENPSERFWPFRPCSGSNA